MKSTKFGVQTQGNVPNELLVDHLRFWATLAEEIELEVITTEPSSFMLLWDLRICNYNTPVTVARVELVRRVIISSLLLMMGGHDRYNLNPSYEVVAFTKVIITADGTVQTMYGDDMAGTVLSRREAKDFIVGKLRPALCS